MTVARLAISFDQDLARAVRRAAGDQPTSAWLADAARRKLRAEGLWSLVQEWEATHGPLLAREVQAAARRERKPKRKRK